MRVISGKAGGRKLKEPPKDSSIRPTSDRVKESIFNIIQFDIEGRRVLDLFAGTGQLGIEALSRGAACVMFADSSAESVRIIRNNLKTCGFEDNAMVYATDALRYLEYEEKFDIILLDPPYDALCDDETPLVCKAVEKIIEFDKMSVNGIIICEIKSATAMPEIPAPYTLEKEYRYGQTSLLKIVRSGG